MSETHEDEIQDSLQDDLHENLQENLQHTSDDTQLLSAEYKDGQLQIVEVAPFDKNDGVTDGSMPVLQVDENTKYVQVLDSDKNMMQLDLLNLTLVRCEDGVESYRLVSNIEGADSSAEATVTCVLHSSDTEAEADSSEAYVVMEGEQGPLVFLQSVPSEDKEPQPTPAVIREHKQPAALTPTEILQKAKALQKAKQQIIQSQGPQKTRRGRKRKSELPPPHELLASPNFKLFLYSCKMCSYKCNAVKDMTAHKNKEHSYSGSSAGNKWRSPRTSVALQCSLCVYKAATHAHLMRHVQDIHSKNNESEYKVILDSEEVEAADVLVCGACGFESGSRPIFRAHIERVHGATTTMWANDTRKSPKPILDNS